MQVTFDLQVGEQTFKITETVESNIDFFKKLSFYADLPKVGPNGETDLKLVYRNPKGYEYYSIVSEQAGMELKFGVLQDANGGLFKKSWEPLFKSANTTSGAGVTTNAGLGAPTPTPTPQQTTPAVDPTTGVTGSPQVTTNVAETPSPVEQQASDVLAKFGIQ